MFFKLLSGDLIELEDESKELYQVQLGRIIGVLPLNIVLEKAEDDIYYVIVNEHPHKHRVWKGQSYDVKIDDKLDCYSIFSIEVSRKKNYTDDWDVYHFDYLTNGDIFFLQKDTKKEYSGPLEDVILLPQKYYHSLGELIYDLYTNRYGESNVFYYDISSRLIKAAGTDIQRDTLCYLLNVFENKKI